MNQPKSGKKSRAASWPCEFSESRQFFFPRNYVSNQHWVLHFAGKMNRDSQNCFARTNSNRNTRLQRVATTGHVGDERSVNHVTSVISGALYQINHSPDVFRRITGGFELCAHRATPSIVVTERLPAEPRLSPGTDGSGWAAGSLPPPPPSARGVAGCNLYFFRTTA